jgi:hypothetical protein
MVDVGTSAASETTDADRRRGGDAMKKRLALGLLLGAALAAGPGTAAAAEPSNASCWGSVTSQFARSAPGAMGKHASSFDTPRLGIGNVAYLNTGTHQPGALGAFLGGLLGFSCD